jgi:hypothetical protein
MNIMADRWGLVACAIMFVLSFGPLQVDVGAADAMRYRVSYGGTAGYQLPLWVNREMGFSKKHGVDLETILIQAGSPNIQALVGGSLQLTQTAASSAVIGATQGAPVVIVATLENKLPMLLVSRPEIKEPQQLRVLWREMPCGKSKRCRHPVTIRHDRCREETSSSRERVSVSAITLGNDAGACDVGRWPM